MFVFMSLCVCTPQCLRVCSHVPCPTWETEDSLQELSPSILWIQLRSLDFAVSPLAAEPSCWPGRVLSPGASTILQSHAVAA